MKWLVLFVGALFSAALHAQAWPSKPLRFISSTKSASSSSTYRLRAATNARSDRSQRRASSAAGSASSAARSRPPMIRSASGSAKTGGESSS